ncbi:dihydrofolate reductase family protein [Cellulomonas sp. URHB0016]
MRLVVTENMTLDGVVELSDDWFRPAGADGAHDVVVTGSVSVARDLVGSGVVDEYRLFVHPAVAGHGRRLFDGSPAVGLDLVESRRFSSGVVLLRYVPVVTS